MKNVSTGFGLCVLGLGIAVWPIVDRLAPSANASAVTAAASAVSTAATAQTGPTIVWYQSFAQPLSFGGGGTGQLYQANAFWVVRAWSDGKVEARYINVGSPSNPSPLATCGFSQDSPCIGPWVVINDPAQGLTYRSDINFDEKVDGADLGQLLADWGNAPRQDIPPSDCPLALINP
jgi:hypothetical protein